MDNIQIHYISQLKAALEKGLSGDRENALNILLEMRLQPDLAFWTRARVNISICAFTHAINFPQKLELARDALRLAQELDVSDNPEKDAYWAGEYKNLVKHAETTVKQAEEEMADITDENRLTRATKSALEDGDEVIELPRDDSNLKNPRMVPWFVEGSFTIFPTVQTETTEKDVKHDGPPKMNEGFTAAVQDVEGKVGDARASD